MAARTLPGLGLSADWNLGETGWKDANDTNLLKISVLLGGAAADLAAAVPGSPSEGDIVILDENHVTYPNQVAVYDEAAWTYFSVPTGTIMFLDDEAAHRWFNGTLWTLL